VLQCGNILLKMTAHAQVKNYGRHISNIIVREPLEEDDYEITIQKVCTIQKLRLDNYY
jgi:hypothetical protein